ncbi:MAG: hypothetical protein KGJ07_06155 [Patescibacteria group bacterium]|nr:hypothetical protein [Patescibacteria group bacterium]MDE2588230.1 hypothetical protein [Patescibacteria group bacterium]
MKKQFYHEVIDLQDLFDELETLAMSEGEKEHLVTIIHASVHTVVLDVILSEVPKEDKHLFLEHVYTSTHRDIWKFLKKRSVNIEDKIRKAVKELKKEFLADIANLKK